MSLSIAPKKKYHGIFNLHWFNACFDDDGDNKKQNLTFDLV
jgi:hypothetical protein